MAITNQERVGKAMELLRTGLAPFVEHEFKSRHQAQAADGAVTARLPETTTDARLPGVGAPTELIGGS
jgi:hypothetical protein